MERRRGERNGCLLMKASARSNDAYFTVDPVEHPVVEPNSTNPTTFSNPEFDAQSRRTACKPLCTDQHARRLASFHHPLQPQPRRKRQTPDRIGRRAGDVEGDEA